jgi:hypothetical protein
MTLHDSGVCKDFKSGQLYSQGQKIEVAIVCKTIESHSFDVRRVIYVTQRGSRAPIRYWTVTLS